MVLYQRQFRNFEFNIETKKAHTKSKNGEYKVTSKCHDIFTFDIECTSAFLENGKVIPYRKGETNEYWNSLEPVALCYIWQFSCNDIVYYGREIDSFLDLLEDLPSDTDLIIWVHNLSYEFAALSNILTWKTVFARNAHKPMKCTPNEYPNIEFRCTYNLTRLSLDAWGKQIGFRKKTGDLDYDIMRTPLTQLTDTELGYCEYDCLVVYHGVLDYLKRYKDQWDIPLTQTGTVRRVVKEMLMSDINYQRYIKRLVPKNAKEYKRLQQVFSGGYTHANQLYSGKVVSEHIEHYDFASSYPTVMVCEKYPSTPWIYTGEHEIPNEINFDTYAYIFVLSFKNIESISFNTYIQASKVKGKGLYFDNGRILHADYIEEITITEQDYITIKNNYEWEEMEVKRVYRSRKDYLPKPWVKYILELYNNKTKYKNVEGYEDIYTQSKQYINSQFGMAVTSIIQASVNYDNGDWITEVLNEQIVDERLQKLKFWGKSEKRYFLSYSWGCWVTAYARRNLWKCIESIDNDVLYCDTDSIFCRGKQDFSWYNKEITAKLEKACNAMDIDFELTRPSDPKGEKHPLGIFDKEDDCSEFITLGAKRYCERRVSDGKLHLTISGINKSAVELLEDDIYNFRDGFNFDKDADCVTKKLCTYIRNMPNITWQDGYISHQREGINLRRTGYEMSLTDEYKDLISGNLVDVSTIIEPMNNYLNGRWFAE